MMVFNGFERGREMGSGASLAGEDDDSKLLGRCADLYALPRHSLSPSLHYLNPFNV